MHLLLGSTGGSDSVHVSYPTWRQDITLPLRLYLSTLTHPRPRIAHRPAPSAHRHHAAARSPHDAHRPHASRTHRDPAQLSLLFYPRPPSFSTSAHHIDLISALHTSPSTTPLLHTQRPTRPTHTTDASDTSVNTPHTSTRPQPTMERMSQVSTAPIVQPQQADMPQVSGLLRSLQLTSRRTSRC